MELIKTKDIAKLLSVSEEQVRRFVYRHGLPCYRLSPRIMRFKEDEVIQWARTTKRSFY